MHEPALRVARSGGFRGPCDRTRVPAPRARNRTSARRCAHQKRDVLGLSTGIATFSWTATGSKIVPGAICENLTSYGGMILDEPQTKLAEFLRNDAAGSSGTVIEPFAIQAKFPHPLIHAHYASGCSLAEAYYQSVEGPFQLLIVGDALCQPWATPPVLQVKGIAEGEKIKGTVKLHLDWSASKVSRSISLLGHNLIRRAHRFAVHCRQGIRNAQ